jgi:hypothetical protein
MSARVLCLRAIDALAESDLELVLACLEELEELLQRQEEGWVLLRDGALVPDMSVFEEEKRGR